MGGGLPGGREKGGCFVASWLGRVTEVGEVIVLALAESSDCNVVLGSRLTCCRYLSHTLFFQSNTPTLSSGDQPALDHRSHAQGRQLAPSHSRRLCLHRRDGPSHPARYSKPSHAQPQRGLLLSVYVARAGAAVAGAQAGGRRVSCLARHSLHSCSCTQPNPLPNSSYAVKSSVFCETHSVHSTPHPSPPPQAVEAPSLTTDPPLPLPNPTQPAFPFTQVVKRFFSGDPLTVQPVGPSPAIMHVDSLKRLTPLWLDLSVKLKADAEADAAFGWVLEMWGYSLACANLGIQNFVWQQLQIEPSATWHQNLTAEEPYIYHYTFGVEYTEDGIPVVGAVGEWSLDKRHYFGGYPPAALEPPPECARECAWVWWRAFNEATEQLASQWDGRAVGGTTSFRRGDGAGRPELTKLGAALVGRGPWAMGAHSPILFYQRGRVSTPFGRGSWEVGEGGSTVRLSLCGMFDLRFNSDSEPTSFTYERTGGRAGGLLLGSGNTPEPKQGGLMPAYDRVRQAGWGDPAHARHPAVLRVLGTGPWAWSGIAPMAFLDGGVLVSPWGAGSYRPDMEDTEQKTLLLSFVGAEHRVVLGECHSFSSTRLSDGQAVQGWVQLGERARSCPRLE